jgi:phosphomannomutase
MDGLRLDWPNQWLLIRASNTEPIVRIIAEAADAAQAKDLCEDAIAVLLPERSAMVCASSHLNDW